MRKIKVAQIGVLHDHASVTFRSITDMTDVFDVVGYATENDEEMAIRQNPVAPLGNAIYDRRPRMTVEEIFAIPDLDAVILETDELHLTKYAIMAAERGLAIHMDKPGGIELADFEKLIALVKEKNLVFHTGYMYRYNPAVIKALEAVRRGDIGPVCTVEAQMNCIHKPPKRQWLEFLPGGMMFFLGCHLVDLAISFMGVPEEVIPFNTCSGFDGVTANDIGTAIFKYKNGNAFIKTSAVENCGFLRRQVVITGQNGTIEINPIEKLGNHDIHKNHIATMRISTEANGVNIGSWHNIAPWETTELFDRYDGMMASFAAMVRCEKVNPYTPDHELEVYRHVLKACGR